MNKIIIKEARAAARKLRIEGEYSAADSIESLASEVEYYNDRSQRVSALKKGDQVVMHTCMEASHPKYAGRVWTCRSDAFRQKGHNYCSIFLEGFSGLFSAEYLQLVKLPTEEQIDALEGGEE